MVNDIPKQHKVTLPILLSEVVRHVFLLGQGSPRNASALKLVWLQQHPQAEAVVVGRDDLPSRSLYGFDGRLGGAAYLDVYLGLEPVSTLDRPGEEGDDAH